MPDVGAGNRSVCFLAVGPSIFFYIYSRDLPFEVMVLLGTRVLC